ncbi:hypothetical protein GIB67_001830 [Kingdonia uniflora]|uniref:Cytochrome b5 heme-binding domain-containing protein n=1 Tax=Kingdonia uniflora TaxID=39325 RepID=A0A7J7LC26_9MAGN|nr:hypothetical protein GIB67_001830 [Kingdonia uniflora]
MLIWLINQKEQAKGIKAAKDVLDWIEGVVMLVYDVTSYLDEHPGGDDVLLEATGTLILFSFGRKCKNKPLHEWVFFHENRVPFLALGLMSRDATEDFKDAGHSKDAIELMKSYCIGELEFDPSSPFIPELEILKKPESKDLIHKFMDAALQYWTIPVAIVGVSVVAGMFYLRRK